MAPSEQIKLAGRVALVVLGFVLLDQLVLVTGKKLINSRYWEDQVFHEITTTREVKYFIVGDCRAERSFDSSLIGEATGKKTLNLGVVAERLGQIEFTIRLLSTYQTGATVLLVWEDSISEETFEAAREEADRYRIWWWMLSPKQRRELTAVYAADSVFSTSGLWLFRGRGPEMASSSARWLFRQPVPLKDRYVPVPAEPKPPHRDLAFAENDKEFTLTDFARQRLRAILATLKEAGIKTILVLPPMHRSLHPGPIYDSGERKVLGEIAKSYGVPLLSYLDYRGIYATHDDWWFDAAHLNQQGAEHFSREVASDLNQLTR